MNKPYTIDKIYADAQITPEGITGVVEAELRICLKGGEFEKFQKQPFYTEMIGYLNNIEKSENLSDIKIRNEDKKRFWNVDAKLEEDNKEAEKWIASGITNWWLNQGRLSEKRIISKIHNLERMIIPLFLMQTAIFLLILSRL